MEVVWVVVLLVFLVLVVIFANNRDGRGCGNRGGGGRGRDDGGRGRGGNDGRDGFNEQLRLKGKNNQVTVERCRNGETLLGTCQDLDCCASPTFGCLTVTKSINACGICANEVEGKSGDFGCLNAHSLEVKNATVNGTLTVATVDADTLTVTGVETSGSIVTGGITSTGAITALSLTGASVFPTNTGGAMFDFVGANSLAIASTQAFIVSTQVANGSTTGVVMQSGLVNSGTVWLLASGVYNIDYETSFTASASMAVWYGLTTSTMAMDTNTITGSTVAATWLHGRTCVILSVPTYVQIGQGNAVNVATVIADGPSGPLLIRVTFTKLR